jgi:WD40 repeat protein
MQYVCAGSSDGCVLIWNTQTTKVEKILKTSEQNSSVLSLAWHPQGSYLISCDNKKKAVIWS